MKRLIVVGLAVALSYGIGAKRGYSKGWLDSSWKSYADTYSDDHCVGDKCFDEVKDASYAKGYGDACEVMANDNRDPKDDEVLSRCMESMPDKGAN